jgi:protein-S-isoprenylcysteine O-methyltransferase Ste14
LDRGKDYSFYTAVFLYSGVMIFIGKEEKSLMKAFGREYEVYLKKVDRMLPLKHP